MCQVTQDSRMYGPAVHLLGRKAGPHTLLLIYTALDVWPEFEKFAKHFLHFFMSYLTEYYSYHIGRVPPVLFLNLCGESGS